MNQPELIARILLNIALDEDAARQTAAFDAQMHTHIPDWPTEDHTFRFWPDHPITVAVGPDHVLAECAAKRRLIAIAETLPDPARAEVLSTLAEVYARIVREEE